MTSSLKIGQFIFPLPRGLRRHIPWPHANSHHTHALTLDGDLARLPPAASGVVDLASDDLPTYSSSSSDPRTVPEAMSLDDVRGGSDSVAVGSTDNGFDDRGAGGGAGGGAAEDGKEGRNDCETEMDDVVGSLPNLAPQLSSQVC